MDNPLLPACYLPPISYFATVARWQDTGVQVEQYEHFPKQTYRNRASIFGANGRLELIIPIKKGSGAHTIMRDVRISNETAWQRLHWMSLQTAYRSSAYFEYYEDEFAPFYERPYTFLLDYNLQLTDLILRLLKLESAYVLTDKYHAAYPPELDFRARIHPKNRQWADEQPERSYHQVFGDRHGTLTDLSVVDLLFNMGTQALPILQR